MGTSHHWKLKDEQGTAGSGPRPGPESPVPLPTRHSRSPDGHEVKDVRHPWAITQEAADADLEHDGDHQDPVPVGEEGLRLGTGADQPSKAGGQEGLGAVGRHSSRKMS